MMLCCSEL